MNCGHRVEIRWSARAWAWFAAMIAAAWLASAVAEERARQLTPDQVFDMLWRREQLERARGAQEKR